MRAGLVTLLVAVPAILGAQTIRLVDAATGSDRVEARLGQIVTVDAVAELGTRPASGVSLYISFDEGLFSVLDEVPAAGGIQPFTAGPLFSGAVIVANLAVPAADVLDVFAGRRLLDYAATVRSGDDRGRSGSGVVASFRLRCLRVTDGAMLTIDTNPVRPSSAVRADGSGEDLFRVAGTLTVRAVGLDLLDIPDVYLLPGQTDSTRIGRLDKYVLNNTAPLDSLRWTLTAAPAGSVQVSIDTRTRRVRLVPQAAFRGLRTLTFSVAEPAAVVTGEPPPSATETARVVVNTPPSFGLRRDTVRVDEDAHTYVVSALREPNPARALRLRDLDDIVTDPEVGPSRQHTAFSYGTLTFRPGSDTLRQVRGRVDPVSHELLVWTRPQFSGVDSFRVLVADEFTVGSAGQDTLRVIVIVNEIPDPPSFLVDGTEVIRMPSGESRAQALVDLVADRDTPLDSLQLTWGRDLGGTFTASLDGDSLRIQAPGFPAQGLFVFTVTDPEGGFDRISQRVTSTLPPEGPGGEEPPPGPPDFTLLPLPDAEILLGDNVEFLAFDDYVSPQGGLSKSQIGWSIETPGIEIHALASVGSGRRLHLRGIAAGVDTLVVRGQGPLGRVRRDSLTVRVTDPAPQTRRLALTPMPDVDFVAGYAHTAFDLDDFVVDAQTHPPAVVDWSVRFLGAASLLVQVRADRTVFVSASDSVAADVVFTARNLVLGVSTNDTVRITAAAPRYGRLPLTFADRVLAPGAVDSLVLDALLPAQVVADDTLWSVRGQRLSQVVIDPAPPHRLRIAAPADRVGVDTLSLRVDLGRGYGARGTLRVRIREALTADDFRVLAVPNAVAPDRVTIYVVSRVTTAAAPVLTRSLPAGSARAVSLAATVTDLSHGGVLVWSGVASLPRATTGRIVFSASGATPRGSLLEATGALAYGAARPGQPLALALSEAVLTVPADALPAGTTVAMAVLPPTAGWETDDAIDPDASGADLVPGWRLVLAPSGLPLQRPAELRVEDVVQPGAALYERTPAGDRRFLTRLPGRIAVEALTPRSVWFDTLAPAIEPPLTAGGARWRAAVTDAGSGIDPEGVLVRVDEKPVPHRLLSGGILEFDLPAAGSPRIVAIEAADRIGNRRRLETVFAAAPLPAHVELGRAYPNPFNPAVRIPFVLPAGAPRPVRVEIWNLAGQRVRRLVDDRLPAGPHETLWNGRDGDRRQLASGVYLVVVDAAGARRSTRVALLR